MEIVFWGTIICLTIAFLGGAVIAWGKYNQDKNSSEKSTNILDNTKKTIDKTEILDKKSDTTIVGIEFLKVENQNLNQQVRTLQSELLSKNNTIIELTQQTAELSIRLSEKARKLYDNVTGGDSYLSTLIYQYRDRPNLLYFHCNIEGDKPHSPGKYPLTDVSIEVYQSNKIIRQIPPRTYGIDIDYDLGDLITPISGSFEYFQIRIFTPKRNYWQHIFLKKNYDGIWYSHIIQDDENYGVNIRNNYFFDSYPDELKKTSPRPVDYASELMKVIPDDVKKHFSKKEKID